MTILQFFDEQLGCWPLAAENYKRLSEALLREISVDGATVKLQCNPARSVSTDAKVDKESIAARKCFLCRANRPPEQMAIPAVDGRYELLVNPYPIFTPHFVIASVNHEPQCIEGHLPDMIRLADEMPGFTVLYNGPACGHRRLTICTSRPCRRAICPCGAIWRLPEWKYPARRW